MGARRRGRVVELTEEQRAQMQARRERFRELVRAVASMTPEQRAAEAAARGAVVNGVTGQPLSLTNTLLVAMQYPKAAVVAGIAQWRTVGRKVRAGSHGLMIWVPTKPRDDGTAASGAGSVPAGEIRGRDLEERQTFFPGYVFEIAQTEEVGGDGAH